MLKRRAFIATLWSSGDILSRQGVQFITTLVLARLLAPADFGVVAMLAVFMGVSFVLMDGGFSAALIQHRDIDHTDESTVFWCNLAIGALLTMGLIVLAPFIANFYEVPVLAPLARLMSLACLLASVGAIHSTLLTRDLDFRTQAKAGAIAALSSGAIAIAMASRGYGSWALVAQAVVMAGVMSSMLWWLSPWRPKLVFSSASLRKLLGFGGYHLGSTLLEVVYLKLYTLLVGRLFGARELGYYSNADNSRMIPANFLGSLISRVALPMFSSAASERTTLRRGIQLSIRGMMLINAPLMLTMAALAHPIVELLFGHQWLPASPILRILCFAGLLYPLHSINLHALMAQGHARLMFRLELVKKTIGVALLLFGSMFGVTGIAWSQVVFSCLMLGINTRYTKRWLDFGAIAQLREATPPLLAAALAAGVVYEANLSWHAAPFVKLSALGATSATIYLAIVASFRMHALADVLSLLQRVQPKSSS
jgi:teichuronic acid exporter